MLRALVVAIALLGTLSTSPRALLESPRAQADDDLDDGDVILGVLGRGAVVTLTTTMFTGLGAGAGFGFAWLACPSLQCPRFHPGARPTPDAPIDPVMLGAGAAMGAALLGGLGAYMSGALVAFAFE